MGSNKLIEQNSGNILTTEPSFNYFGCAIGNVKGLHLKFEEIEQKIRTSVCLGKDYESFPGVIHGGIVGTVLDEVMAQVAYRNNQCPAMTIGLRIRYIQPMKTGNHYIAKAEITSQEENVVKVSGQVESEEQGLISVADGTFVLLSAERLSSNKLNLPDATVQYLMQFVSNTQDEGIL